MKNPFNTMWKDEAAMDDEQPDMSKRKAKYPYPIFGGSVDLQGKKNIGKITGKIIVFLEEINPMPP